MLNHYEDGLLTEFSISAFTVAIIKLLKDKELYARMRKQSLINAPLISSELCSVRMLEVYQGLIDDRAYATRVRKPFKKRQFTNNEQNEKVSVL